MNNRFVARGTRWLGGCATVVIAACFVLLWLDLLKPPRELAAIFPTPTATRRPPPTITPVVYPPTPPLALNDDFSSQNNFPRSDSDRIPFGYLSEGYRLNPPLDPGFVRVLALEFSDNQYRDLSVNTSAESVKGSPAVEYGILFWHGDDGTGREHFLAFTVASSNLFRLRAYEPVTTTNGAAQYHWTDLVPATPTTALNIDGRPNRLRVDVHPRRVLAYINDSLVIDTSPRVVTDWRSRRDFDGRVGLIALAVDEPGAQVNFSRFDVYADVKQP